MISKNTILKNLEKYLKRSFKGKVRINESSLIAYLLVGGFFCFVSNVGYATVAGKGKIEYKSTGSSIDDGLAINSAQALGNSQTIAIGGNDHDKNAGNAIAKGAGSIAIGGNSRTEASTGVAVGWHAEAKGENGTAYGESTVAEKDSVAIGSKAEAKEGATALGAQSKAKGNNAISVGRDSKALSNESIVVGHEAEATATASQSVTVGYKAKTEGQNGVTIGTETSSIGNNSVVIGKGSKVAELTAADQVDGVDYSKLAFDSAVVIGNDAVAKQQYAIVMGQKATGLGEDSFAFGRDSKARKNRSIAFGKETLTDGVNAIAFGERAQAYSVNSVSIASGAKSKGEQALAFGNQSNSNGQDSIAIGTKAMVGADIKPGPDKGMANYGTALGGYSNVNANGGTTIGSFTTVNNEGGVALGIDSIADVAGGKAGAKQTYSAYNSEKAGAFTSTNTYNGNMRTGVAPRNNLKAGAVSVGKADGSFTRQIVGLAAGTQDTDAVNVAQLKSLTMKIEGDKNEGETPKVGLWDGSLKVSAKSTGSIKASTVVKGNEVTVNVDSTDLEKKIQAAGDVKAAKTEVKEGDSGNVTVNKSEDTTDKHPVYTVDMKKDITLDRLTVRKEKDKDKKTTITPGRVSVNGKNGSGVTLNGADGSIGLKGENGKDALSIKGEKGQAGVDGKNGTDGKTRIVYEYWDPKNPKIAVREEVATLNDGIKYKGDSGEAYTKLNKQTEIVGGQKDTDKLSENNIGVVASQDGDNAKLTVKLAKELKDLTSVETKDKDGNKTEITKDGMTITPKDLEKGKTPVKLTKEGLDNGGNKITNVAEGKADTDAVNVAQLKTVENMIKNKEDSYSSWEIQGNSTKVNDVKSKNKVDFVSGEGTTAEVEKSSENKTTVKYSVNKSTLKVADTGTVSAEKKDGTSFATAEDVAKAINDSEKTTTVVSGNEKLLKVTSKEDKTKPLNTEYTISLGDTAKKAIEDVTKNKITVKGGEQEANSFVVSEGGSIDVVAEEKDGIVKVGVDSKRKAITVGIDKQKFATEVANNTTVQNNVNSITKLQSTTIALAGNSGETDPQSLSKQKVKFTIKGEGIESIASGETVTLSIKDNTITKQKLSDDVQLNFSGNSGNGAVKVKDGTFEIKGENGIVTEASNSKLVVKIADETKKKIDNAANNNLSNITDSGKTVIHNAIAMEDGENTKVSHTIENGVKTFKVDVKADGKIKNGDNKIVTGDTVYKAIEENKTRYYSVNVKDEDKEKEGSNYKNDGATAEYALAAGPYAKATAKNAAAFGYHAEATKENSVALGAYSTTNEEVSGVTEVKGKKLTFGAFAGNNPTSQVSVGSSGKERQIKHVAAGAVTQNSTDAVNGSQLHATNLILEAVADSTKNIIGGPTQLNSNGTISVPDGKGIANTTGKTVHEAIIQARTTVTGDSMIDAKDEEKDGAHNYKLSLKNNSITEEKLSEEVKNKIEKTFTVSANSGATDTVKKDENIDFSNTDGNITIGYDAAKNKFTHDLSKNLQNIDTIGGNGSKISFVDNTISVNNSRITNVADGNIAPDSKDAVNGGQLHVVKQDVKAAKTEVTSKGKTVQVTEQAATDGHTIYNVEVRQNVKYATEDGKEVILGTDGNFYHPEDLNDAGKPKDGKVKPVDSVKAELAKEAKLDKVADGKIADKSKEAINGDQFYKLGTDILGLTPNAEGIGFNKPSFTALKKVDGSDNKAPENIIDSVNTTIGKVNEGFKYGADMAKDNQTNPRTQQLGSTLFIKSATEDLTKAGNTDTKFVGKNIVTNYENNGGNGTVSIGISEKPEFKEVTLKDGDGNTTTINKDGMTITPKNLETGKTAVKLTKNGLDNGGNKITNVADGTDSKDAVNKSQLDKAQAAATTKVEGSENIQVDKTPEKDGSMTYTVKTKDKMTLGKDSDKKIVADGETGKLTVGKEVEMDGTTGNARFGKVKVNGEKGTVGGLTNKTWDKDNIVSGQAATEDQLQVLDKKMQNNTEELINKGMDFSGNDYDAKNAKTKIHKKLGDRLEIIGGLEAGAEADSMNLRTRVTDDGKLELLMAKNPKFKSVEAGEGDTKVTIGNTGIQIGDKTYITKDGIDANNNKIKNVADGTEATDAVNKGQLDKAQAAATTKVNGSENIEVDGNKEKDGSMTYTVKTKDKMTLGKDVDKQIVVDGETGKLTVGKEVQMDGTTGNARFGKVQVNGEKGTVGGLTNTTWDKNKIVSGQAATEDQLKAVDDKVDNLGNKIDETTNKVEKGLNFAADTGKATNRQLGDTLTIAGDDKNITTSVEEGKVKVALKEDVKVKTLTSKTVTTDKLILKGKDGKTTDVGETLDKHDADIKKGLNFAANHGEVNKQLGDTMSIKGKDGLTEKEIEEEYDVENIVTSVDKDGNLWIKMAKNPKFKSVEAGEGDTKVTIGDIGIKIGDKTYITKDGINANDNKIKNVADGKVAKGSKDAINGGQLHDALSNVQEGMNQINHRVDKLDDRMHRGLANAAAMSTVEFLEIGINQATVGAAIGTYRGNQAVAVGVQAAPTENMRVHAKVSVAPSRNNTETMAGVGASWRFNIK